MPKLGDSAQWNTSAKTQDNTLGILNNKTRLSLSPRIIYLPLEEDINVSLMCRRILKVILY